MKKKTKRKKATPRRKTLAVNFKSLIWTETARYFFFFLFLVALAGALSWLRPQPLMVKLPEPPARLDPGAVLPHFDNRPADDFFDVQGTKVYTARRKIEIDLGDGKRTEEIVTGFAFVAPGSRGGCRVLVGLDSQGRLFRAKLNGAGCNPKDAQELEAWTEAVRGSQGQTAIKEPLASVQVRAALRFFAENKEAILAKARPAIEPLRDQLEKTA